MKRTRGGMRRISNGGGRIGRGDDMSEGLLRANGGREFPAWGKVRSRRLWYQRGLLLLVVLVALVIGRRVLQSETETGGTVPSYLRSAKFAVKAPSTWSDKDLERYNSVLSKMDVDEILRWSLRHFPHDLIQLTSFGPSGLALLHKLHSLKLLRRIPVVTIDTLHLFPETYSFLATLPERYHNMNLVTYHPQDYETREDFDDSYGPDLWRTKPDMYGYVSKIEPTLRAFKELKVGAYLTGRRRDQGGERSDLNVLEWDTMSEVEDDENTEKMVGGAAKKPRRIKINALASWSYDDVWSYLRMHRIPYNPLHDRGYKSVGDTMTTRPVSDDAPERSGRFVGLNRTECGLHSHLKKVQRMREEAEEKGEELEIPKLPCEDCVDVDTDHFDDIVVPRSEGGTEDLLLEFYSPLCGSCQEFSPRYAEIGKILRPLPIRVGRFDITEADVPKRGKEMGIEVEATPDLYLVRKGDGGKAKAIRYEGSHNVKAILAWLEMKTSYVKVSDLRLQ